MTNHPGRTFRHLPIRRCLARDGWMLHCRLLFLGKGIDNRCLLMLQHSSQSSVKTKATQAQGYRGHVV